MLSQPFLKVGEFNGPWFLQRTRGEPSHPVVMDAKGCGYLAVSADRIINRFSGLCDAFLNIHVLTL
jgi:hypothetical protein